ncbi:MAG TPA: HD domain-containing protein [Ktedonobacterales bacterium]
MLADDISLDRTTIEAALAQVRALLRRAYTQPDAFHGPQHAEEVLRLAEEIARRMPGELRPAECLIVSAAALLHDVGYTAYQPDWAPNRSEHVAASIAFAQRQLTEIAPFAAHPPLIAAVSFLIGYHDDTSYKFPSFVWDGRVGSIDLGWYAAQLAAFEVSLSAPQRERLRLLLAILREADALTAAGEAGAARSFQYAIHRGLPIFARGNPLNAWCWEESAAGNTRLAAKRALIDAFTPEGRRTAWESYRATEAYLRGICTEHGMPYVPETIVAVGADDPSAISAAAGMEAALELISYAGWGARERAIRDAAFADSPAAQPSAAAGMTVRHLPLDLLPDVLQAVDREGPQTAALVALHARLLSEYALSLFDLAGVVEYRLNGSVMRAMPPIVERHPASLTSNRNTLVIRDGAATIALARKLGVPAVWVVDVDGALGIGGETKMS